MFIYSVRAGTLKFCAIALALATLITVIALTGQGDVVSASSSAVEINYSGIKTAEDRQRFIASFGIELADGSEESADFRLPENFDRVILGYNELQKKQGLDLLKYKNKKVTRYTYRVTNYNFDGEVYANLYVYRSKIVACDLSSADPTGFVIPLTLVDRTMLK